MIFVFFSPELSWRDVQHLVAMTAKVPDPKEPGWTINGAGHHVHHRYTHTHTLSYTHTLTHTHT